MLIDDQAHRSFVGMGTHIYHGPGEPVVADAGHGDEKLTLQALVGVGEIGFHRYCHGSRLAPVLVQSEAKR